MYDYSTLDPGKLEYISVAGIDEIENGERLFVDIDDIPLVIFNIAGDFFAIQDECTHDHESLGDGELQGFRVTCPRHGAEFDVRNGKACTLPAVIDVPAYPTRIIAGKIEVGLPLDT
jgi:3-phenylpropionate/trans-cinnamate dioxygenase ferredoxin subunit